MPGSQPRSDSRAHARRGRWCAAALAAVLLAAAGLPLPAWTGKDPRLGTIPGVPTEQVTVRLVLLHATVLNRRGETVEGLGPEDFEVSENDVPQEISVFGTAHNHPLKIAFLLDVSGSMSVRGKLERAKTAIREFVEALRPEDQAALLIFADGDVAVEQPFTTDRLRFDRTLTQQEAWGRTALRDALATAPTLLAEARAGRKALVLVTDGIDNASQMRASEAIRTARKVAVPIYAIGLTDLPEHLRSRERRPSDGRTFLDVMQEFARETGGDLFPVFSTDEVRGAVDRVQERLRSQYVIGYSPQGTDAVGFRRIDVVAADGRYRVKTRNGYYASN